MIRLTRRAGLAGLLASSVAGAARAASAKPEEVAYGTARDQRIDVYPQAGLSNAPVVVYVHGGAWTRGDKHAVNDLPSFAERNGFLLMSAGYRLAPDFNAGVSASDVAAAFAWAKSNAAKYGGDPAKVYLVGHSAGAHLVVLIGVDPVYLAKQNLTPKDISGVIALDGAGYDAVQEIGFFDRRGGAVAHSFHQAFEPHPEAFSPTLLVKPGLAYPPFLILYITARADSPIQSRTLAAAIRNTGGKVSVRVTSDRTHAEINQSFGKPGDPEGDLGAAFIKTGVLPPSLVGPVGPGRGRGRGGEP